MSVKIVDTYDRQEWNSVAPHPLVSWEWGEARARMGIDVLRIAETSGEKLMNVFQLTFHQLPHTSYTIGYMPRTFVPSEEVIDVIKIEASKRKAVFVKTEPYVRTSDNPDLSVLKNNAVHSPHPLFTEWTQMLDLKKSEDELLKNMKSKWRYNIRLAEKKGVTVEEKTSEEGFREFADLYFQTTGRQKYAGHNREYHKIVFEALKDSQSHILIAYYNGEPLSAYHLFHFNDTLYYPYGGSSDKYREVMASNIIMWEAIRLGKKLGAKEFDMWGSLGPDYDRSAGGWAGFTRFKEGFGTEFVQFVGSYDVVLNPVLYRVYNVADVLRKRFLI